MEKIVRALEGASIGEAIAVMVFAVVVLVGVVL